MYIIFSGQPSYFGETPLGFACGTNQWDIVEILLRHGADLDVVSIDQVYFNRNKNKLLLSLHIINFL